MRFQWGGVEVACSNPHNLPNNPPDVRGIDRVPPIALKASTPSSAHCTPLSSTFILVMLFNQGTSWRKLDKKEGKDTLGLLPRLSQRVTPKRGGA